MLLSSYIKALWKALLDTKCSKFLIHFAQFLFLGKENLVMRSLCYLCPNLNGCTEKKKFIYNENKGVKMLENLH
jgi:hypothetical protein